MSWGGHAITHQHELESVHDAVWPGHDALPLWEHQHPEQDPESCNGHPSRTSVHAVGCTSQVCDSLTGANKGDVRMTCSPPPRTSVSFCVLPVSSSFTDSFSLEISDLCV